MAEATSLLPGLTHDVALVCLSFIPFSFRPRVLAVCRQWRELLTSRTILETRQREKLDEEILCVFFLDPGIQDFPRKNFERESAGNGYRSGNASALSGNSGQSRESDDQRTRILMEHGSVDSAIIRDHELVDADKSNNSPTPSRGIHTIGAKPGSPFIHLRIKALPAHIVSEGITIKPSDWFWLPPLNLEHEGPCDVWDLQILSLGSSICVVGGTTRVSGTSIVQDVRRDVHIFNGITMQWEKSATLNERGKKLVATCDPTRSKIFIASSDEPQAPGSPPAIKIFDVASRSWDRDPVPAMPPTSSRRYLHGASCREGNFYLFLIDPDTGKQWSEFYDPIAKLWSSVPDMATKKAVINVQDKFLCVSNAATVGTTPSSALAVEEFEFETNSWRQVRQFVTMEGRRSRGHSTVADCFLVGLQGKVCVIESCQEQSPATRKWDHKTSLNFVTLGAEEDQVPGDQTEAEPLGNLLSRRAGSSGVVQVRLRGEVKACLGATLLTV